MQQAVMQRELPKGRYQRLKWLNLFMLMFVIVLMLMSTAAEAKRVGGGSFGRQSSGVTQRSSATPAQRNAQSQQAGQPRKPWGGMLGGLAAGLGLAALFSMLGFGPLMSDIFGTLLLVFLAIMAIRFVLRLLNPSRPQTARAGAGQNDHRARVFEQLNPASRGNAPFQGFSSPGSASEASWGRMEIPAGMDVEQFESVAKTNFVRLQKAWDGNNLASLKAFLTDEMFEIMKQRLQAEQSQLQQNNHPTEIVTLNAQLLGVEDLGNEYMASVEFSGMLRDHPDAGAEAFVEVWNLTKSKDASNSGWLLAGIQQVQK